jgi:hypothetical protein
MSGDSPLLSPKWFAVAAILALSFAAGVIALVLLNSHNSNTSSTQSDQPAEKATTAREDAASQPSVYLKQSDADGRPISWGAVAPGFFAKIEVVGAATALYNGTDFFVSKDGALEEKTSSQGFSVELTSLSPGRYQWRANLKDKGRAKATALTTPRMDAQGADWIVVPPALALSQMEQGQFDGAPIGSDLRARNGVRMSAHLNFPGASWEVEVKPVGSPFDGKDLLAAPASGTGTVAVAFQGSDGSYHWRARAMAAELPSSQWVEFRAAPDRDFDLFNVQEPQSASTLKSVTGAHSTAYSSAGSSEPLESIILPQASLWSFIMSSQSIAAALVAIAILAYLVWHRRKSRPAETPR